LSISVASDLRLSRQVEDLARAIVGETASLELDEIARRFAEAQVDLDRIRKARQIRDQGFQQDSCGNAERLPEGASFKKELPSVSFGFFQ